MKRKTSRLKYKKQLKINSYNLEEELIKQPQLYFEWASASVQATKEKEAEKNKLDIIKAEVERKIRSNPEKYGSTEGAVKNAITLSSKVKRQTKVYLEALANERILSRAETAFQQRKSMLVALVQLNIQLHFAEPSLPKSVKEKKYRSRKDEIRKTLKRRR